MTAITSPKHGPSDFADLAGVYYDRPALVMCGGPSLPEQVEAVGEADWLRISANEHGVKLLGDAVDYIVALDNIPQKVHCIGPPVIGLYMWAQHRLCEFWDAGNSGIQSVWVAHAMGCNPIVIAGADCYQTGTYFWDKQAVSSGTATQLPNHLQAWAKLLNPGNCDSAAIRAAGGPLVEVFGQYEPGASYERKRPLYLKTEERGSIVKPGTLVEFTSSCAIGGEHYDAGRVARLSNRQAQEIITLGKARAAKEPEIDRVGSGSAGVSEDVRPSRDSRGKRGARAAR